MPPLSWWCQQVTWMWHQPSHSHWRTEPQHCALPTRWWLYGHLERSLVIPHWQPQVPQPMANLKCIAQYNNSINHWVIYLFDCQSMSISYSQNSSWWILSNQQCFQDALANCWKNLFECQSWIPNLLAIQMQLMYWLSSDSKIKWILVLTSVTHQSPIHSDAVDNILG